MLSEQEINTLPLLGLSWMEFVRIQRLGADEAEFELSELKIRAKKGFRKAAQDLHPDKNGGDAEKSKQFVVCTELAQKIARLELEVPEEDDWQEAFYARSSERVVGLDSSEDPDFTVVGVVGLRRENYILFFATRLRRCV